MNIIQQMAESFLYSLAFGTFVWSFITPSHLTGVGFTKLVTSISGISFFLMLIVDLTFRSITSITLGLSFVILALFVLFYFYHRDVRTKLMWGIFIALNSLLLIYPLALGYEEMNARYFYILSSVGLLGITNYAMTLGHYYLVVPKLSERPLIVCLQLFWAIILIKIFWGGVEVARNGQYFQEGTNLGEGFIFNWIIVSMRWLWGYAALFILSIFTYKLCKIRSIQSATGVLYIMVFFVFVGEMISYFFSHKLGIFL
jgi:hypothetical protein